MNHRRPLDQMKVAISISNSDDMGVLGLAPEHIRDALVEVTRHLLAMGARLIYGGDLRDDGFTKLLFELVARHQGDANPEDERAGIINYLSFPFHTSKSADELRDMEKELTGVAEIHYLDLQGKSMSSFDVAISPKDPSDDELTEGLTAMRAVIVRKADAHVILGGRLAGYKGMMPGVAEETLLAFQSGQPVFLLGGFGGCARKIAEELQLRMNETLTSLADSPSEEKEASTNCWVDRFSFDNLVIPILKEGKNSRIRDHHIYETEMFQRTKDLLESNDIAEFATWILNNGLNSDDNKILAQTVHIDEAVPYILRGLIRQSAHHSRTVSGGKNPG